MQPAPFSGSNAARTSPNNFTPLRQLPNQLSSRHRHGQCSKQAGVMYSQALELAREERFEAAREAFEAVVLACPDWQKPWVSYAQMERRAATNAAEERWRRCREVLQRALTLNPTAAKVICAWGLMELKRGNYLPAVRLLERCVVFDADCEPVLRWKPVKEAQLAVSLRRRQVK